MKKLLLLLALAFPAGVVAAPLQAPCTQASPTAAECDPINSSNPEPVVVSGTASVQPIASGDIIVTPSANFTRPANTTAYVAGQLVANSVTAGSVVPLSWTAARIAAGNFYIRRVRLMLSSKSVTNTSFLVHFYSASPTIANGDGATWTTNLANLVCDMPVTVNDVGSDVSNGFGVPAIGSECNVALASGQTLYGLVSASAAYAPASGETVTVIPEIHQN